MKSNLYSVLEYQNLCEDPAVEPLAHQLFDDKNLQHQIYGLSSDHSHFFGMHSPFWLPNFLLQYNDYQKIEDCIENIIKLSKSKPNIENIYIKLPPPFYSNSIELCSFILESKGFKKLNFALWQMLDFTEFQSLEEYETKVKHSTRKILKKYKEKTVRLNNIETGDYLSVKRIYDIINNNRKKKKISLRYSLDYLINLIHTFQKEVLLFSLEVDGIEVAAAICHETAPNILYVAAWGDFGHSLEASPMNVFARELLKFCIKNNYRYLDFGVSIDQQILNVNLHRFKQSIGCRSTYQNTYKLELRP